MVDDDVDRLLARSVRVQAHDQVHPVGSALLDQTLAGETEATVRRALEEAEKVERVRRRWRTGRVDPRAGGAHGAGVPRCAMLATMSRIR